MLKKLDLGDFFEKLDVVAYFGFHIVIDEERFSASIYEIFIE